ncbi:MAG: YiiD C-terminal domain-containing protein [Sphingobacteriales bacterium]|nr:YiiD C-terminal domain-containing protein [Sphingobacteriales bacterium]
MKVSANTLKWALRFYPPLFFQRIWVKHFAPDFTSVEVKIHKSLLNTNYNQSIFGGTIFAATDPFYALLFDQLMKNKGFKTRVWLKSAHIQYLKPARHHLYFKISLSQADIDQAEEALTKEGKFVKSFPLELYDKNGLHCASVMNEVYMRNLHHGEHQSIAY